VIVERRPGEPAGAAFFGRRKKVAPSAVVGYAAAARKRKPSALATRNTVSKLGLPVSRNWR
jgi:hypothetical protein